MLELSWEYKKIKLKIQQTRLIKFINQGFMKFKKKYKIKTKNEKENNKFIYSPLTSSSTSIPILAAILARRMVTTTAIMVTIIA